MIWQASRAGVASTDQRRSREDLDHSSFLLVKAGFPANDIRYGCLIPQEIDGLLAAGNCISVIPGSTFMGLQLGSYNNIKDIPSMWTTGEAAGTAAAICARDSVVPRKLHPGEVQKILFGCGALVSPEHIAALEGARLPSGTSVKEFYERTMADCRAYWQSRGEAV